MKLDTRVNSLAVELKTLDEVFSNNYGYCGTQELEWSFVYPYPDLTDITTVILRDVHGRKVFVARRMKFPTELWYRDDVR